MADLGAADGGRLRAAVTAAADTAAPAGSRDMHGGADGKLSSARPPPL